jgi:hypothetical protein
MLKERRTEQNSAGLGTATLALSAAHLPAKRKVAYDHAISDAICLEGSCRAVPICLNISALHRTM